MVALQVLDLVSESLDIRTKMSIVSDKIIKAGRVCRTFSVPVRRASSVVPFSNTRWCLLTSRLLLGRSAGSPVIVGFLRAELLGCQSYLVLTNTEILLRLPFLMGLN